MSRRTRIRLLKAFLLGLVVLTIGGVVALYQIGKNATFRPPPGPDDEKVSTDPGTQQQGSGFDHTVSQDGRPLFRMRGGRDRRDQDGNLFVENVLVNVYRPDGTELEVVADEARYNLETESAELRGAVTVAGDDGLGLETEELILKQGGRVLESTGAVAYRYGLESPLRGTAERLRADLEREVFFLMGGVEMTRLGDEQGDFDLRANRVLVERSKRLVRANGNVRLRWAEMVLDADQVAATLDPFEDRLRFLRAHWKVAVRMITGAADTRRDTRIRGSRIGFLFDGPGGALNRIEVEDEERGRARIDSHGALGSSVYWKTEFFQADFRGGELSEVEAVGRAEMVEYLTSDPEFLLRRICSARSSARFGPDGEMQQINVTTDVDLQDRQAQVHADTARMTPQSLDVEGDPVLVEGGVGRVTAPRVTFADSNGLVHATGGVEAVLPEGDHDLLSSGPLGAGEGPVRITAEEGFLRPATHSFLFQGDVRAWSGPRLLRAQTLRGDRDPDQLVASGGVESVFSVQREGPDGSPDRSQMRVTADTLTYQVAESLAVYRQKVEAVEGQRRLACDELRVEMDEESTAEKLDCKGSVRVEMPEEGRTVQADRAEYDVAREEVVFTGTPVELTERTGAKLRGSTVVYSTRDRTVRVRSGQAPAPNR